MQAVLYVPHDGYNKMVGKVFPMRTSSGAKNVFFHEESGSQGHYLAESPGGLDCCVVAWLRSQHVNIVYHKTKGKDARLLVTSLEKIMGLGIRRFEARRRRVFLPWGSWDDAKSTPVIPWVTAKVVLNQQDDYMVEPDTTAPDEDEAKPKYRKQRTGADMAFGSGRVASAWHPLPAHPCSHCGGPTAQPGACILCQSEGVVA